MTEAEKPNLNVGPVRDAMAAALGHVLWRTEQDEKPVVMISVGVPPEPLGPPGFSIAASDGRAGIVKALRTLATMFRAGSFEAVWEQSDLALLGVFVSLSNRTQLEDWVTAQMESDLHGDGEPARRVFENLVAITPEGLAVARQTVMDRLGLETVADVEQTRQTMRGWLSKRPLRRVEDEDGWGTRIEAFSLVAVDPGTSSSISVVEAIVSALRAEALSLIADADWPGRHVAGQSSALAVWALLSSEAQIRAWVEQELGG